jgi:SPP1 gp7 family putative phage head morphogenesis protein
MTRRLLRKASGAHAARSDHRQIRAVAQAEDLAAAAGLAVDRAWAEVLRILRADLAPWTLQAALARALAALIPAAAAVLAPGLTALALTGYHATAADLTQSLPVKALAAAVVRRPLLEATPPGPVELALTRAGAFSARDRAAMLREPVVKEISPADRKRLFKELLFPAPDKAEVEAVVNRPTAQGAWQDTLKSRLARPEEIATIVAQGTALGRSRAQIARDLEPVVGGVKAAAQRIARTEGARVSHEMRMQADEQLGDLVAGWQLRAVLDSRSRPWHAARHGTIYWKHPKGDQLGIDLMPRPPYEPNCSPWWGCLAWNCRCHLAAVLAEPAHLAGNDNRQAAFANASGQVIPDPDVYGRWFEQAPEREQRLAVGSRRYDLVSDRLGRAPAWADFLDPATGELVPLKRLREETPAHLEVRRSAVAQALAGRRTDFREAATFGFRRDPNAPTPPHADRLPSGKLVEFVPHPQAGKGHELVMADVAKLDQAWAMDADYYIPPGGGGRSEVKGRREAFVRFLEEGEPVQAPLAGIADRDTGRVAFDDGRHRFSALRDLGAKRVGVSVPKRQAADFRRRFGG